MRDSARRTSPRETGVKSAWWMLVPICRIRAARVARSIRARTALPFMATRKTRPTRFLVGTAIPTLESSWLTVPASVSVEIVAPETVTVSTVAMPSDTTAMRMSVTAVPPSARPTSSTLTISNRVLPAKRASRSFRSPGGRLPTQSCRSTAEASVSAGSAEVAASQAEWRASVALAQVAAVLVEEPVEPVDDDLAVDEVREVQRIAARLAATRELPPVVDGAEPDRVDEQGGVHLD